MFLFHCVMFTIINNDYLLMRLDKNWVKQNATLLLYYAVHYKL